MGVVIVDIVDEDLVVESDLGNEFEELLVIGSTVLLVSGSGCCSSCCRKLNVVFNGFLYQKSKNPFWNIL